MKNDNVAVVNLALKCVGLCCLVDKELAKKQFLPFFFYISDYKSEDVWISAASIIFDLLLKYDFDLFIKNQELEDGDSAIGDKMSRNNIIDSLMALLDSQVLLNN